MKKNIVFLLFLNLFLLTFQPIASKSSVVATEQNVLYIHGFTGRPDGWKKLIPAIADDANVIAPALPDTKPVKGIGFNKIVNIAASLWGKNINRIDSDLGHAKDVKAIVDSIPKKPFIGYGICRGGSALINTVAQHNPEDLQALVIESAYASYPKLLYGFLSSYGISTTYAESLAKFLFPSYQIGTLSCQKSIPFIKNKDLPILILHSKDDTVIPISHSWMLYKAFVDNGFKNVYLVELQGQHAYSLRDDKQVYLTAIHSFYKQHNLPYKAEYAIADMELYRPNVMHISQKITKYYDLIKRNTQISRAEVYNSSVGKLIITAARLQKQPFTK